MKILPKSLPYVFFLLLIVVLIFIPFFEKGFIFSYDGLFFYPKIVYKLHYLLPNQAYFLFLLEKLSLLIPTWIIQRLIWFFPLFFGSLGCFYLFGRNYKATGYLAGIFFIFNPFVYERMVMGQITVLLGLSLYPWVILFLYKFFSKKKYYFLIIAAILYGMTVLVSPHSLFILGLLIFAIVSYFFIKEKNYIKIILSLLIFLTFVTLINFNWLSSSLKESNGLGELSTKFSQNDFIFYETSRGGVDSLLLNVLALDGHWGEKYNFFKYHLNSNVSKVSTVLILFFILLGIFLNFKDQKKRPLILLSLAVILSAVVLTIGKAHPLTDFLTKPFYQYLPFYKGLREPQKWVSLILICYIFLFSSTFEFFWRKKKNSNRIKILLPFLFFLPLFNSHQILWGLNQQLKVNDFPSSWYQVNNILNKQDGDFGVLFLPWRFYINLSFAGREIINPSLSFFDKFTFIGDDIKVGNTFSQFYNKELDILNKEVDLVNKGNCPETKILNDLNISYIILAKEENWTDYSFLNNCQNIKLINDFNEISLFKLNI